MDFKDQEEVAAPWLRARSSQGKMRAGLDFWLEFGKLEVRKI